MGHGVISLTEDFDLERLYGDSKDERGSSKDSSSDTLLLDDDVEEGHMTFPMPPPILCGLEM